jgi:hypothetical protein
MELKKGLCQDLGLQLLEKLKQKLTRPLHRHQPIALHRKKKIKKNQSVIKNNLFLYTCIRGKTTGATQNDNFYCTINT